MYAKKKKIDFENYTQISKIVRTSMDNTRT